MDDSRLVEPLQHRRLRLHAFSVGIGIAGGIAATAMGRFEVGIVLGLIAGFVCAPLVERWLIAKNLSHAVPSASIVCIGVCAGAGVIPHAMATFLVAVIGSLIGVRMATSALPDVWPPHPEVCGGCGYDLRGLEADACPECGLERPGVAGREMVAEGRDHP